MYASLRACAVTGGPMGHTVDRTMCSVCSWATRGLGCTAQHSAALACLLPCTMVFDNLLPITCLSAPCVCVRVACVGGTSQHKTRSAAAAYSSGVRPAGPAGGSSIPDPFATFGGMQAAAAAAAAAMQDTDMPDPFSMTGCWYAAAAAGTAPRPDMPDPFGAAGAAAAATAAAAAAGLCGVPPAGPAPAASLRAEHHAGGAGHRGPRRHGAPLQTVVECSESPGSSARLHTLGPAAAAAAAARPPGQQGSGVLPGLAEEAPATAEPSSAGDPAAADQWPLQERVAQLAKQLQVRRENGELWSACMIWWLRTTVQARA